MLLAEAVRAPAAGGARVTGPMVLEAALPLLGLALLPLLLAKLPPLTDYAGHLARMRVIASGGGDPLLAAFYSIDWRVIPDLAMDAIVPPLAGVVGLFAAGKLFIALYIVLIVGGAFAVHYAVHCRLSLTPLLVFFFLYNRVHIAGATNYLFGLGIALWGLAAWIALRNAPAWHRALVSLLFVLALFASHLFALGLYGLTLLAVEADRWHRHGRAGAADLASFLAPFLVVPVLLALSPTATYATAFQWDWSTKVTGLWWPIRLYRPDLDLATGIGLALAAGWALRRGLVRLHPAGAWLLIFAVPLYLAMPAVLFGSWGADVRLPLGVLLVAIGFADVALPTRGAVAAFLVVVGGLSALRFGEVAVAWRSLDRGTAAMERSVARIELGSTVLVADGGERGAVYARTRPLIYTPCLALIERSSFVSNVFAHPGKQPLVVRPAYRAMADSEGGRPPPLADVLRAARDPGRVAARPAYWKPDSATSKPYWAHWPERFDYLYVLYPMNPANPAPDLLATLQDGPWFQLYKVRRPS